MSKKVFGIILALLGIIAFHLTGSQTETAPIWQTQIPDKIYSAPVLCNSHALFIGGNKGKQKYNIYQIATKGSIVKSIDLPSLTFSPVAFSNIAVVADKARMIRGFSVPGLQLKWESATLIPLRQAPIKINDENFIVTSDKSTIFCLNSKTGKPVWQKKVLGTISSLGFGKIITCTYGYTDTKNISWKLQALDPEDGETLWTLTEPVGPEQPAFLQDICVLTDKSGKLLIIDQNTGSVAFRGSADNIKIVKILGDKLIMLASGGTRLICMSLMTGNSWTTTLQSGFIDVSSYNDRLMIADKKNLRCLADSSGALLWKRELNDVYSADPFYKGMFVTYKDSFFARITYGSYIDALTGQTKWGTSDKGIFYKPIIFGKGYLLTSYTGQIKLIPSANTSSTSSYSSSPQIEPIAPKIADPIKVNFFKNKTVKKTDKSNIQDEDLDDTGWTH